jgi:predicted amidohydrolase YtcJ
MDGEMSKAEALSISGEMISLVGGDEEVLALAGPKTTVIDLEGRTLMPGFVDAHTHLFNDAEQYFDMSLPEVQQLALENGITSIGNLYVDERFLKEISAFAEDGLLRIRTSLYLVATDNCGRPQGEWYLDHPPTREPGEMLRIGGVKIFADGGTCERPAMSYELRPGEGLGDLFFSQEGLNELVSKVHGAGYQAVIHAIGDRAVEQAQNSIAAVLNGGANDNRHRIDHNAVIRPDLMGRYGEIGIIPVIFGMLPICKPWDPFPPPEFQSWDHPNRALLEANPGLPIAWHGDDPFAGRVRPLDDLYSLVTRNDVGEEGQVCEPPAWHLAEAIPAAEALPMMTRNSAYALFRDEEVGSLSPGMYADLIVLSGNPLDVTPAQIKELEVWLTMVGGRVEYCAAGHETGCP